jgi:hypothetical protein
MILSVLLLAAGTAFAEPAPKVVARHSEETLAVMLFKLRQKHTWEVRRAVLGAAEELRDAVAASAGSSKEKFADRLPGMAKDPFGICRDLVRCPEAPLSFHVEDAAIIDDAILALARPWFKLQNARGKAVTVTVDPGVGVRLDLEGLPQRPAVTFSAMPTSTGGFDVTLDEGAEAAKAYAAERAAVLRSQKN